MSAARWPPSVRVVSSMAASARVTPSGPRSAVTVARRAPVPAEAGRRDSPDDGGEASASARRHAEDGSAGGARCGPCGYMIPSVPADGYGEEGTRDRPPRGIDGDRGEQDDALAAGVPNRPDPEWERSHADARCGRERSRPGRHRRDDAALPESAPGGERRRAARARRDGAEDRRLHRPGGGRRNRVAESVGAPNRESLRRASTNGRRCRRDRERGERPGRHGHRLRGTRDAEGGRRQHVASRARVSIVEGGTGTRTRGDGQRQGAGPRPCRAQRELTLRRARAKGHRKRSGSRQREAGAGAERQAHRRRGRPGEERLRRRRECQDGLRPAPERLPGL